MLWGNHYFWDNSNYYGGVLPVLSTLFLRMTQYWSLIGCTLPLLLLVCLVFVLILLLLLLLLVVVLLFLRFWLLLFLFLLLSSSSSLLLLLWLLVVGCWLFVVGRLLLVCCCCCCCCWLFVVVGCLLFVCCCCCCWLLVVGCCLLFCCSLFFVGCWLLAGWWLVVVGGWWLVVGGWLWLVVVVVVVVVVFVVVVVVVVVVVFIDSYSPVHAHAGLLGMCIVSFSPASLYPAMVDRCRYYRHSGVTQKRHGHGCIIHTAGQCNMMKVSHLGNVSLIILVTFGGFHKWCCPKMDGL